MEKQTKKVYEVPALTVVSFKVEQGYALSALSFAGFWDGNNRNIADSEALDDYDYTENGESYNGYWQW